MSAQLVNSYNEQVLNREPTELGEENIEKLTVLTPQQERFDLQSPEDEERPSSRSRHTSTSSSADSFSPPDNSKSSDSQLFSQITQDEPVHVVEHVQRPLQELPQTELTIVEKESTVITKKKVGNNTLIHRELEQEQDVQSKEVHEQAVKVNGLEKDENDWAIKNQGSSRINALIARFNKGTLLEEHNERNGHQYKSDYGVGKGRGQLRQDVFH